MPRRGGRLEGLLAVAALLVIVAAMAVMTWGIGAPASSGVGTQDANLKAGSGSALVHDDAGNMPSATTGSALVHDDAGAMAPGADSVVVHDDAGNVKP
jgi:hypothetical protein